MRRIARGAALMLAAMSFARPAAAQGPEEFRSSAELTLATRDALHRFPLPLEAYRDMRRDLADIRIHNAALEVVPFAFASAERAAREPATMRDLRAFPVHGAPGGAMPGDLDVSVRTRADGTVISVQPRSGPTQASREAQPAAWLLDANALDSPVNALVIDWEAGPGTEVVQVNVEGSTDLRRWHPLASRAALVRVEQGGEVLSQPRIDLASLGRRLPYLRIAGTTPAFRLRSARAEVAGDVAPVPRLKRAVLGVASGEPGGYVFDLGARLPVETVRIILPEANTVAPVRLLSRDSERAEWVLQAQGTSYRLLRGGVEIESLALQVGHRDDRYWMMSVDARSGGIGSAMPSLEVSWLPMEVVFVARGEPPFRVSFGSPDAPNAALMLRNLAPGRMADSVHAIPVAQLGAVITVPLPGDGLRRLLGDDAWRRLALWAVLLLGVGLLAYMAWKLSRQMQGVPPADGA